MGQLRDDKLLKLITLEIKSLRQKRGITQEAFYIDTGIHLARIETGKLNLTVSTLSVICNYFEVSLSDFFKDIST